MFHRPSKARVTVVLLAMGLGTGAAWAASHSDIQRSPVRSPLRVTPPPKAPPAVQQGPAQQLQAPVVINLKTLSNKQIRALPDSAVVEFRGTLTTMGALRAQEARAHKDAMAKAQALAAQVKAKFEARRVQFLQQQQAELQSAIAKARAEVARLIQTSAAGPAAQQQAIRSEAIQLMNRAKTASPAEQVQIEQRAGQILKQLQQAPR